MVRWNAAHVSMGIFHSQSIVYFVEDFYVMHAKCSCSLVLYFDMRITGGCHFFERHYYALQESGCLEMFTFMPQALHIADVRFALSVGHVGTLTMIVRPSTTQVGAESRVCLCVLVGIFSAIWHEVTHPKALIYWYKKSINHAYYASIAHAHAPRFHACSSKPPAFEQMQLVPAFTQHVTYAPRAIT